MTIDHESGKASAELAPLATSVRRLTVAVWCLVGLFGISYAAPWIVYLATNLHNQKAVMPDASRERKVEAPIASEFDHDFYVRPPKEQIKRATVILVTKITHASGNSSEVISEIVKHAPSVRFYYKLGDISPMPSHVQTGNCGDCGLEGQIVLLQGNPAGLGVSYGYKHDHIDGMGGMSLTELRQLAQESLEKQ